VQKISPSTKIRSPDRPARIKSLSCLWCYRWSVVVAALLLPPRSNGKTRGSWCSYMLLMMGVEAPKTCWATHKRQVINLWNCCIWSVNLFESFDDARTCKGQMRGLAKVKWNRDSKLFGAVLEIVKTDMHAQFLDLLTLSITAIYLNIQSVPRSKHTISRLQQNRQYTYNVTLRPDRATIADVEK
jgi:hypothetical protein